MERNMEALKKKLAATTVKGIKISLAAGANAEKIATEYLAHAAEIMNAENKTEDAE